MEAKKHHHNSVSKLEDKVKELERKCDEQSSNFSRLSYELSTIRHEASSHIRTISTIGGSGAPTTFDPVPLKGLPSTPSSGLPSTPSSNGNDVEKWKAIGEEAASGATRMTTARPVTSGAEQRVHSEFSRGKLGLFKLIRKLKQYIMFVVITWAL